MRELEGFSYKELGEALDVSQPAVKSLLVRARMGLAEAAQARDTACEDIREDLAAARDRRVRTQRPRPAAPARLRRVPRLRQGAALHLDATWRRCCPDPGLLAMIAGLLGSAARGGRRRRGRRRRRSPGIAGGGAAAATATKVAVAVCCVAATAGGAASVEHTLRHQTPVPRAAPRRPDRQPASAAAGTDLQMGAVEPDTVAPAAEPDAAAPTPVADAEPLPPDEAQATAPASDEVTPAPGEAEPPDDPRRPPRQTPPTRRRPRRRRRPSPGRPRRPPLPPRPRERHGARGADRHDRGRRLALSYEPATTGSATRRAPRARTRPARRAPGCR